MAKLTRTAARSSKLAGTLVGCLLLVGCGKDELAIDKDGLADLRSESDANPALAPLDFIAGSWRSLNNDGLSEEIWSLANGTSMVGVFRIVKPDGALSLEEVLSITAEGDGVFLRLRHFDAKLIAREEKDGPIVLKLEKAAENLAVFRRVSGSASLDAITYHRVGQTLHGDVAFTPESKRETLKFEMRRIAVQPW